MCEAQTETYPITAISSYLSNPFITKSVFDIVGSLKKKCLLSHKLDLINMNSNNLLNCGMFVIFFYFKGITVLLGRKLENFDLIALQPNLLWWAESITEWALYNKIERFKKNIFSSTTLSGWVLSYFNRLLLRLGDVRWSALQQWAIKTKGIWVL